VDVVGNGGSVTRTPHEAPLPVSRPRLLDEVTDRILAHIRDAGLRPGDRLPSNRALSERFLIAVPTLREALRRLEATGAVELRHGSGVYVRADVARLIMVNPNRLRLDQAAIVDLLEARELIEPHLAAAAARNATDGQLADLEEAFSRTTAALSQDQALHVANMGFHRTIARLAGNGALAQVLDSLIDLHDQEQRHILDLYGDRDHDHRVHGAIFAAVRGRRPDRARRLLVEPLRDVRVVVTRALTKEGTWATTPTSTPSSPPASTGSTSRSTS
jgi:GntR family transcriptional regulator, transcriptional repressor for pyruvate dehydrogenase complex